MQAQIQSRLLAICLLNTLLYLTIDIVSLRAEITDALQVVDFA